MFDLKDKKALVTGASGGIGQAIAKALHAQGAHIVLTGTRENVLNDIRAELGGERAHVITSNLSDKDAAASLIEKTQGVLGGLDILINNAGITRDQLFMRMKDEDWDAVLEVNLNSVFRLSRACLKGMMKQRFGRIINITSVVGLTGNPGQGNYVAAKAGLTGMSKALAQEVASRGITVNCVAPGFIETAMTDKLNEKQKDAILDTIPAGKLGSGDDVAAAVVFLASQEAGYITGQTVHVNGGMAML
jgi:3-oxoacyl-[acyl-carrier protein] reductase